ncbi:MAG: Gfo/Idh/MocA family protein [Microthrixaceae bacterium]
MNEGTTRILVLGAGSIGTRHARNLIDCGAQVDIMDLDPGRASEIDGGRARALDLNALEGYAGIVVATPTSVHGEHCAAALVGEAKVLAEKPLAADPREAAELALLGADRLCVAYNLRFHEPLQRAMDLLHDGTLGDVSFIRLWFGSWLPDWRPTTDYRSSYSAQRAMGGGVLLDAIHELDLLLWAFPDAGFAPMSSLVARLGPLDIDVEDTAVAVLRSRDGRMAASVSLDYLARRYRRGLEATGTNATLRLDWSRQVLEVEDASHVDVHPADVPIARSYELQDQAFLRWVQGGPALPVDAVSGAASVALAAAIRDAAR